MNNQFNYRFFFALLILHEVTAEFHEYGDEHEQNPFEQVKPCDEIHWFDPVVHAWLYDNELSAGVFAERIIEHLNLSSNKNKTMIYSFDSKQRQEQHRQ